MKPGGAILLGMAFAVYLGGPASSATIKSVLGKDRRVIIQIFGQIAAGDADIFIGWSSRQMMRAKSSRAFS
jgi:hypothetical protein